MSKKSILAKYAKIQLPKYGKNIVEILIDIN